MYLVIIWSGFSKNDIFDKGSDFPAKITKKNKKRIFLAFFCHHRYLYEQHRQDADDGHNGGEDAEAALRQELHQPDAEECANEDKRNGTGVDGQRGRGDV